MKPVTAIFLGFILLAGSILPHTDGEESGKIPQLVRHYQEDKQAAGQGFGFLEFISQHYGWESAHAESHRSDPGIPGFHTHCTSLAFIIPASAALFHFGSISFVANCQVGVYKNAYVYLFSDFLLRPPRA